MLQSIILICLKNCHLGLKNTQFRTCLTVAVTFCILNSLKYYEFSCKMLMQLSRNSSQKPGTNLSDFFLILIYYYMVFKMALYLFLEKKIYFCFQLENILRLFEVMKMIFKKLLYLMDKQSKGNIQPDIHNDCQICFRLLYRYSYKMCSIYNAYEHNEM